MADAEYYRQRRKDRRKKLLLLLGGRCENCGSKNNLEFDHINPKKKKFHVGKQLHAPFSVLENEVKKCRLLCKNCHVKKTHESWDYGKPPAQHGTIWYYKKYKCRCDDCKKAMSDYNKK